MTLMAAGRRPSAEQQLAALGIEVTADLTVAVGELAAELRTTREGRAAALAEGLRYAPIAPIVLTSQQAITGVTTFASAELWGPKTGYFWSVLRVAAAGLAPGGNESSQQFSSSPTTAFQTLTTITGLVPFAAYTVNVTTTTSGTTGAPEFNNMRLAAGGTSGATTVLNVAPGGTAINNGLQIQTGAPGTLVVTTGSNVPTTGSVYAGDLQFTSQPDNLNLYRGQPQLQNFLNDLQLLDPTWSPGHAGLILQPGDFLTAQGTGLVGTPVAVGFDVAIGTLDLLAPYLLAG